MSTNSNATQAEHDRSDLLKEAVALTMAAAHGLQRLSENQISQMLGNLVRTKLLSADDSYRLRDQLLDSGHFEKAFNDRVEASLRRAGIVTNSMMADIQGRLGQIEKKSRTPV
jgi:polyhydroxyalkanoate synthesis regulator phasin